MSWVMVNLNIKQLKLRKNDLEFALICNSDAKQALHYQQTCKLENLNIKYDGENDLIEKEFDGMDESDYSLQAQKLTKLYELSQKKQNDEAQIANEMSIKETDMNRRQEVVETQLEAVNADLENMEKARDKFIEQECAYFKNEK